MSAIQRSPIDRIEYRTLASEVGICNVLRTELRLTSLFLHGSGTMSIGSARKSALSTTITSEGRMEKFATKRSAADLSKTRSLWTLVVVVLSGLCFSQQIYAQTNPNSPLPPVANAGSNRTVVDTDGLPGETVVLDGSQSNDPDGQIVSYVWSNAQGVTVGTG